MAEKPANFAQFFNISNPRKRNVKKTVDKEAVWVLTDGHQKPRPSVSANQPLPSVPGRAAHAIGLARNL
jgi:hypothetical protein